jgi:CheY-like chemotaxis protein/HPt (histidine-containing phosphotransfer) domain-containing protein
MNYRVLIVDDVIFSIDVLKHFINSYGIGTNCVTSGKEAINLIREEKFRFSAVFIDQRMPELDGVQTARGIRETGTKYAGTIPLIAISADAAADDKGAFLLKGFQDFISKPIDISQLDAVIRRWVFAGEAKDAASAETHKSKPTGIFNQAIDGINMQRCPGHFGGDEELFAEFLRSFVKNIPDLIKTAEIGSKDMKNYAIYVHGLKGSCRNICADELSERAGSLEKAANAGDVAFIDAGNREFLENARQLIENIKNIIQN